MVGPGTRVAVVHGPQRLGVSEKRCFKHMLPVKTFPVLLLKKAKNPNKKAKVFKSS